MQVPRQLAQEGSWDQGGRFPSGNGERTKLFAQEEPACKSILCEALEMASQSPSHLSSSP